MSFYIDDPKTEALANELARIKGISPEQAIRISVVHALEKLEAGSSVEQETGFDDPSSLVHKG